MSSDRTVSVRALLISLLQAQTDALDVQLLLRGTAIFGINGNAARVALSRLVREGIVESDGPGRYRVSQKQRGLSVHLARWRLGEKRVTRWNGDFFACLLGKAK